MVAGATAGAAGPAETPREMELLAAAVRAGEDAAAKEAADAANAHAAHYRALAEANDAAVKETQGAFDEMMKKQRRRPGENRTRWSARCRGRRRRGAHRRGAWQKRAEEAEKKAATVTEAESRRAPPCAAAAAAEAAKADAEGRVAALLSDVEAHRAQMRSAQQMYEQEVVQHATDIKRLSEEEARRAEDAEALASARDKAKEAAEAAAESERRFADEPGASETARRDAEAKTVGLQKQNALLLGQLEDAQKAADGVADEDGENAGRRKLHEVVTFLRNEKEAALGQVEVLSLEVSRVEAVGGDVQGGVGAVGETSQGAREARRQDGERGREQDRGAQGEDRAPQRGEREQCCAESRARRLQEGRRRGKEKGWPRRRRRRSVRAKPRRRRRRLRRTAPRASARF